MRNSPLIQAAAGLATAGALLAIWLTASPSRPRIDRALHAAIGQALAKETLLLLPPDGKVTLITRDTESFPQPALDILLRSFERELGRTDAVISTTHLLQTDPLRPVEVPSGDFYELIRRASAEHVIVSLLGPPLLSETQRKNLGPIKPKIVAFCPGSLGETIDLRQLFQAGLLHTAVTSRPPPPPPQQSQSGRPAVGAETFDQLYRVVRAADFFSTPAVSSAATRGE